MARPKTDLPPADAILALRDGHGRLAVRVTPGARSQALEISGGRVLIRVRAKPEDGKANAAVLALLAKALGCTPSHLTLAGGAASREKIVAIAIRPG